MIGIVKMLTCLSAAEFFIYVTALPVPPPMMGMAFMLIYFAAIGQIDPDVSRVFDAVSRHIAFLFVPAGAGILTYASAFQEGLGVIVLSILAGTLVTILVTALSCRLCFPGEQQSCSAASSGKEPPR